MGHKQIIDNFKEEKQKIRVGLGSKREEKIIVKKKKYIYILIFFLKKIYLT